MVRPGSFCPSCHRSLSVIDNIPLLSFLLSRGRCRYCGERISVRYPLVEFFTAVVLLVNYRLWGFEIEFFSRSLFFILVAAMAFIDGEFYIIPDRLSLGGLGIGLLLSFFPGDLLPKEALLGAFVGGGVLYVIAILGEWILKKEAMGMGDVKMMAMIGSFAGWAGVIITIFLGSLLGTIVFGPLNVRKRRLIPFGIFLAVGGLASLYYRDPIIRLYLSAFM